MSITEVVLLIGIYTHVFGFFYLWNRVNNLKQRIETLDQPKHLEIHYINEEYEDETRF